MHLSDTDWGILEACSKNRETRPNLAAKLDVTANYISKKLSEHKEKGLIEQPGPAEKSGMWVTSPKGELVFQKAPKYEKRHEGLFGALIESAVTLADTLDEDTKDRSITPQEIIITSTDAWDALKRLESESRITTDTATELLPQDNIYAVYGILYELWFFDFIDRAETSDGEIYDITGFAREVLDQVTTAHPTPENINRNWLGLPERRGDDGSTDH